MTSNITGNYAKTSAASKFVLRGNIKSFDDARVFARQCLANHRTLKNLLENTIMQHDAVSSYKGNELSETKSGKHSSYYDDVPWWYQKKEDLAQKIKELRLHVQPIERMLRDIMDTDAEMYAVYKLKYDPAASWARAKDAAWEKCHISERRFRTIETALVRKAMIYLGLGSFEAGSGAEFGAVVELMILGSLGV